MVGFILMIDEFRTDNGATCFVPGSHHRPIRLGKDAAGDRPVVACGPAGSMILYNGAVWHGHVRNETHSTRRSIQGAFIRRDLTSGFNLASRMRPETLSRIGSLATYLIVAEREG
jgi:ectoine hydroxylase-related dioxygenase (phytanoyl-CoA dioxygenase family)